MDFGGFLVGIDRSFDLNEIPVASELIDERSQV
jgi:hypothetical protein